LGVPKEGQERIEVEEVELPQTVDAPPQPVTGDPEAKRAWLLELTRSGTVLMLLLILVIIFALIKFNPPPQDDKNFWDLTKQITTGLLTLLGTALAFYFSSRKRDN